jgi:hypothetical protein
MAATQLSAWDRLLAVATLGTRRAPVNETSLWPAAELAPAGAEATAELKFLRAAAAQRLYDIAGTRSPQVSVEETAPVPVDRARFVSEAAALRLLRMIRGEHAELIQEWSHLALGAGRQLPPQFVPLALTHLKPTDAIGLGDLLGATGQWLVRMNPDWKIAFTVEAPSHERWLSGTFDERRAELSAMRKHDPAVAREWLQETWAKDPPEEREAFLRSFANGLSLADEAFLETALDDKRKSVRQAAVQLLASLPESQLSRRHCARLDALITVDEKKGLLARKLGRPKLKLIITLPEAIDKATQRDGIEAKVPAHRKIGERAFWLSQIVALAPLSYWVTRFQCEPEMLVAGVMESDYAEELLPALSEAAQRYPERQWLLALTQGWMATKDALIRATRIVELLKNAPHEARETVLATQLSKLDSLRDHYMILSLLQTMQFAYGPELTRLALTHLRTIALKQKSQYPQPRNLFDPIGYHCDVSIASGLMRELLEAFDTQSNWRNAVEQLNDIVDFRAAMRRELL